MKKVWISRVTPQGLKYMESVTVRSRRRHSRNYDKALYAATTAALYIMTAALVYVTVPMAWAVWKAVLG